MTNTALALKEHDTEIRARAKNYLATMGIGKDCTQNQLDVFIEIAVAYGLDPFKHEIYASVVKGKLTPMVGYPVYIKRAERSGKLDGWTVETAGEIVKKKVQQYGEERTVIDRDKSTLAATITIYRKDRSIPFTYTVGIDEFCGSSPNWVVMPKFMIKKTAIAHGFRWCFPDELGGMPYTEEEIEFMETDSSIGRTPPPEPTQEAIQDSKIRAALRAKLDDAYAALRDVGIGDNLLDEWALEHIDTTDYQSCKNNRAMTNFVDFLRGQYRLAKDNPTEPPLRDFVIYDDNGEIIPPIIDDLSPEQIDFLIGEYIPIEYPDEALPNMHKKWDAKPPAEFLAHLYDKQTKRIAKQAKKGGAE